MNRKNSVCIIGGLGHVGLPLGLALADNGLNVTLYDLDAEKIKMVSNGKMPFLENKSDDVLKKVLGNTLKVTGKISDISESYFIIIVIGTPVDEHLNPKFNIFKKTFDELLPFLNEEHHIVLRSTVFPGTTNKIKKYLDSKNLKIKISFCPERIAQGAAMEELFNLPQIISSFDECSKKEASELFSNLTDQLIYLDPMEAELAKLFNNVYRYILFSISNQFFQIASSHNLDFYKIYDAITKNYPRAQGLPTPGFAAGPCLFKDTMQLAAFDNNNFFLGHAAMLINEGLPNFIIQSVKKNINLEEKNVGILGMAFKANNDDSRSSLSYKLKKLLEGEAKQVFCSDHYINDTDFVDAKELIEHSDIIFLGTPHKVYKGLDIPENKILIDVWNFFKKGVGI